MDKTLYSFEEILEHMNAAETLGLNYKVSRSAETRRNIFNGEHKYIVWRFTLSHSVNAFLDYLTSEVTKGEGTE